MIEEELMNHLSAALVSETSDWDHEPLCAGAWKTFDQSECLRILARLSTEQITRSEDPIPFHNQVRRLRGTTLPHYPDSILVEGELFLTEQARQATFAFLLNRNWTRVLQWTQVDVAILNGKVPVRVETEAQALAYLHFHCGVIYLDDDRRRIIETAKDILWSGEASKDADLRNTEIQPLVKPVAIKKLKASKWSIEATVCNKGDLFEATFEIGPEGETDMTRKVLLLSGLETRKDTINGPFRVI